KRASPSLAARIVGTPWASVSIVTRAESPETRTAPLSRGKVESARSTSAATAAPVSTASATRTFFKPARLLGKGHSSESLVLVACSGNVSENEPEIVRAVAELEGQGALGKDGPLQRQVDPGRHPRSQVHHHDAIVRVVSEEAARRPLHEVREELIRDRDEGERLDLVQNERQEPVLQPELREGRFRRERHAEPVNHCRDGELARRHVDFQVLDLRNPLGEEGDQPVQGRLVEDERETAPAN